MEFLVCIRQAEEQFLGFLLIFEMRCIIGLDEIKVEIPWRNGGGAFIG